jgi:hypothetical protein
MTKLKKRRGNQNDRAVERGGKRFVTDVKKAISG